jgi:hypothetical protein
MIINVSLEHVFGVDASNGEIRWRVAFPKPAGSKWDLILCVTPLFHNGMV